MTHIPALDGIRAVAVLLVLFFHAQTPGFYAGYLGVDVFFVLSGFLITSLLLGEIGKTNSIQLRRFYFRRLTRLMPPLIGLIALYLVLAPIVWPEHPHHIRDAFIAGFYLSDYSVVAGVHPAMLKHSWSLSIEQHYYLLWPLVLLLIVRFRSKELISILFGLYIAATLWRIGSLASGQSWDLVYLRFDTRLSGLVLGSLLAACLHYRPNLEAPPRRWMLLLILGMVSCIGAIAWKNSLGLYAGVTCAEILTAAVILIVRQPGQSSLQAGLSSPVLVYLGKISYSLYLFHYPVFYYLRDQFNWQTTLLIGLPLSIALAVISYYTLERMGRKPRLATLLAPSGR